MRFTTIALMSIALLIRPTLPADCSTDCNTSCFNNLRTALHFRSQGANTARELVGWQWELNKPEMCENYGAAYLASSSNVHLEISNLPEQCLARRVFTLQEAQ